MKARSSSSGSTSSCASDAPRALAASVRAPRALVDHRRRYLTAALALTATTGLGPSGPAFAQPTTRTATTAASAPSEVLELYRFPRIPPQPKQEVTAALDALTVLTANAADLAMGGAGLGLIGRETVRSGGSGGTIDHDDRVAVSSGGAAAPVRPDEVTGGLDQRAAPVTIPFAEAFARFGACTATHVGQGFFLTAGHCVDQQVGFIGFRTRPCGNPLELHGDLVACRVVAYRFDARNDYALLALDQPSFAAGLAKLPIDYGFNWPGTKRRALQLFGYSKGILRMNPRCVGRWEARSGRVLHDCDTEGGDSGSALVDLDTGHVIGVHGGALAGNTWNYGYAITQLPWAESVCVSVASTARVPLVAGGAPAVFRVSTTGLGEDLQRLVIELAGQAERKALSISIFGPDARLKLDTALVSWDRGNGFRWRDIYSLSQRREGPWSVEVSLAAGRAKKGYVDGRIWVCP